MCTVASIVSDSLRTYGCVACQAFLSMGFSRHEYCSEVAMPSSRGFFQTQGLLFSVLAGSFFTTSFTWETPHASIPSPITSITHQKGTFVFFIIDEPLLIHNNHSKSIVYHRSMGLDKSIMGYIGCYNFTQSIFIVLETLCVFPILLSPVTPGNHWHFYFQNMSFMLNTHAYSV